MATSERDKLTDVLHQTEPLLGGKTDSFEKAYPAVASLRVEVLETEMVWPNQHAAYTFTEKNFCHAVNCSIPVCFGGGIEIGWLIHDAVSKKLTQVEDGRRCRGNEGSPRGRRIYRTCQHKFIVKATIEYRPPPAN